MVSGLDQVKLVIGLDHVRLGLLKFVLAEYLRWNWYSQQVHSCRNWYIDFNA
jgi:hypothetical protein